MADEFSNVSPGVVRSARGFTVKTQFGGGVVYVDERRECLIDSEWMGRTKGIMLYRTSRENKGFERLNKAQIDGIYEAVGRALEFQGYEVEIIL